MSTRRTASPSPRSPLEAPRVWRPSERARILPRLVPLTPDDLADASRDGRARVLEALGKALRSERRRGRARHWSYSLDRHVGLIRAWAAEADLWRRETGSVWRGGAAAPGTVRRDDGAEDDERRGS